MMLSRFATLRLPLAARFLPALILLVFTWFPADRGQAADRPNILWITSEDNGPQLGCYGDKYSNTPHIDALARRGLRYTRAWSNAPVCAPARTTIISGRYPTGDGSEDMRSEVPLPAGCHMYPQLLREAGYYCTNNVKEDYNYTKPDGVWDESSGKAHYKKRPAGTPFFAIFNITTSHESQIRAPGHTLVHDPAQAPVPPYHPDTPEVRRDWAQYYDKVTQMDEEVGRRLDELAAAGHAEDTIIFYYGDHGAGMPRSKRWPYHSGLHVPLVIFFPPKYAHLAPKGYQAGGTSDRLVSFVDLAPTLLSIIGTPIPPYFQGSAFAGAQPGPEPKYLHGFRGRMDERFDLVRSVTDGRYVYLRQYMPHLPYGQYLNYMFQMPTTRVWKSLADAGSLTPEQTRFWLPKPPEELYDLQTDPWEMKNLADSPEHRTVLVALRQVQEDQARKVRDLGFIPEAERLRIAGTASPRDAFASPDAYPLEEVLTLAGAASALSAEDPAPFLKALTHPHAVMRYWGVLGLHMRGTPAVTAGLDPLREILKQDESPSVRIAAALALGEFGPAPELPTALEYLLTEADPTRSSQMTATQALNALDTLGPKAQPVLERLAQLPQKAPDVKKRLQEYVVRLRERILSEKP
jgi:uncharacterized sulfatase